MPDASAQECDVVIVGGGIAGVSAAHHLAPSARVVLLEAEPMLAHHTTGRSAAQLLAHYGGPINRRLTLASRAFLESPPVAYADTAILTPLPFMYFATVADAAALATETEAARQLEPSIELLDGDEAIRRCPALRPGVAAAMYEPGAQSIDVMALHQLFVRGARAGGATIQTDAEVVELDRRDGRWLVTTPAGRWAAPTIVNAAGAWGDPLAALAGAAPLGLRPLRRTAFTVSSAQDPSGWPFFAAYDGSFYAKPEAGSQLLCSPADETPSEPCDARAEEIDVARAIDDINRATTLDIRHVHTTWAGLRTFAPDRHLVVGWDPEVEGFCWLVGQGGTGIQTSPAAGRAAAAIVLGEELPDSMLELGLTREWLGPQRLAHAS